MIEYLQKLKGTESNQLTEKEKSELEHLRVEIKKYKDIEKNENLEIEASEGSESESEN
jgi:hypothetical protein